MGNSESSDSRDYKQQLGYYPNYDKEPKTHFIVEQRHFREMLNGEFSDLFEVHDYMNKCL